MNITEFLDTQRAVETISELFTGMTPTLHEVCNTVIEYCDASELYFNDNVYLMTAPNGKKYTGQTTNFDERINNYRKNKGSNPHWSRALKKYGFEKFKIEHVSIPTVCADIVETFMILWYDLMDPDKGYNKQSGGKNGFTMSNEVREKISQSTLGVPKSADHKAAIKASWSQDRKKEMILKNSGENNPMFGITGEQHHMFGKKRPEHSKKMSGENHPMYGIKGENNPNFGSKRTKETKEKQRAKRLGSITSEETKEKQRAAKLGEKSSTARAVVVNGTAYPCAKVASEKEFPDKNKKYVSHFIWVNEKKNMKSTDIFYVSKEFHDYCKKNECVNITHKMFTEF